MPHPVHPAPPMPPSTLTPTTNAARPPAETPPRAPHIPDHLCDEARHILAWAAHVDAGRIGTRIPVSPEIAANRDRWTALAASMPR